MEYEYILPLQKPVEEYTEGWYFKVRDAGGALVFMCVTESDVKNISEIVTKYDALKALNDRLKEALKQIRDLETECCPRCEGNGNIYADGKAHYMSENAPTIPCGNCGGSGRILPEDAQIIAEQALKEAEK